MSKLTECNLIKSDEDYFAHKEILQSMLESNQRLKEFQSKFENITIISNEMAKLPDLMITNDKEAEINKLLSEYEKINPKVLSPNYREEKLKELREDTSLYITISNNEEYLDIKDKVLLYQSLMNLDDNSDSLVLPRKNVEIENMKNALFVYEQANPEIIEE